MLELLLHTGPINEHTTNLWPHSSVFVSDHQTLLEAFGSSMWGRYTFQSSLKVLILEQVLLSLSPWRCETGFAVGRGGLESQWFLNIPSEGDSLGLLPGQSGDTSE